MWRAIRLESGRVPVRIAKSIPSLTRSAKRFSSRISTFRFGCRAQNSATLSLSSSSPEIVGTDMRMTPVNSSLFSLTTFKAS
ncbi:hypothetical protein D3C87_1870320 [compost metagenome]